MNLSIGWKYQGDEPRSIDGLTASLMTIIAAGMGRDPNLWFLPSIKRKRYIL